MYRLTPGTSIYRLTDNATIPHDTANSDYAEYLRWLSEGNTAEPIDPVAVPQTTIVTMRQARLALLGAGKLDTVASAISAMLGATGQAAQIEWEFASHVDINSPLVSYLGGTLDMTQQQLQDLFNQAGTL